jgi:ribA/ribD-fused uncharacterized protein
MKNGQHERTYVADECVVFRKTKEQFGGLSNMAGGFPLHVNGVRIWSSEALYQACRFPSRKDVQELIIAERSPMTAKMKSKRFREFTRPDWESTKLKVMRWCLRVKLAQNWQQFGQLLLSTGQKPIVEESHKDDFWGAKRLADGTLVGANILGRFLMELRDQLLSRSSGELLSVPAPDISQFVLFGQSIGAINGSPAQATENGSSPAGKVPTISEPAPSSSQRVAAPSIALQRAAEPARPENLQVDSTGAAGVHLAGLKITKELGYIFRPKPISDIGIDAEIEIRADGKGNGRLIAAQIKSGDSYLRERTLTGIVFRGSTNHLKYWLAHTVPVILIVCDLKTEACYWQLLDLQTVQFHKSGWSTEIPFSQRLDSSAVQSLSKIGARFQKRDLIDVLFKNWLLQSNYYELVLADIAEQPREYRWLRYLGKRKSQFVMADYVMADLKTFPPSEIDEMVRSAETNHRAFSYDKLILGLVSETRDAFPIPHRPKLANAGLAVELVPLVLKLNDGATLCELGADGSLITSYFDHTAWDDWARPVVQQRIEISASAPRLTSQTLRTNS